MLSGAVALVLGKPVPWKRPMIGTHDSISIHLGNDRGGGYAPTELIPPFNALLRYGHGNRMNAIYEEIFRSRLKGEGCPSHGLKGGPEDIVLIHIPP